PIGTSHARRKGRFGSARCRAASANSRSHASTETAPSCSDSASCVSPAAASIASTSKARRSNARSITRSSLPDGVWLVSPRVKRLACAVMAGRTPIPAFFHSPPLGGKPVISLEQRIVACALAALVAAVVSPPVAHLSLAAAVAVAIVALASSVPLARLVPPSIAGARRRRPGLCAVWLLLAALGTAQTARLSAFMTDITRTWGSTIPAPVAINHQCLGAYVYAADLARRQVPNLYDAEWYPAYAGACGLPSAAVGVRGLGRWVVDPYMYPPPFLILPR